MRVNNTINAEILMHTKFNRYVKMTYFKSFVPENLRNIFVTFPHFPVLIIKDSLGIIKLNYTCLLSV